jgi:cytochrome P450
MHPGVQYPLERVVPKGGAELSGHFLPEGTIVGMNAAVIHRNKDVFGIDADEFRPSRWTEDGKSGDLKEMERSLLTVNQHLSAQQRYYLLTT